MLSAHKSFQKAGREINIATKEHYYIKAYYKYAAIKDFLDRISTLYQETDFELTDIEQYDYTVSLVGMILSKINSAAIDVDYTLYELNQIKNNILIILENMQNNEMFNYRGMLTDIDNAIQQCSNPNSKIEFCIRNTQRIIENINDPTRLPFFAAGVSTVDEKISLLKNKVAYLHTLGENNVTSLDSHQILMAMINEVIAKLLVTESEKLVTDTKKRIDMLCTANEHYAHVIRIEKNNGLASSFIYLASMNCKYKYFQVADPKDKDYHKLLYSLYLEVGSPDLLQTIKNFSDEDIKSYVSKEIHIYINLIEKYKEFLDISVEEINRMKSLWVIRDLSSPDRAPPPPIIPPSLNPEKKRKSYDTRANQTNAANHARNEVKRTKHDEIVGSSASADARNSNVTNFSIFNETSNTEDHKLDLCIAEWISRPAAFH